MNSFTVTRRYFDFILPVTEKETVNALVYCQIRKMIENRLLKSKNTDNNHNLKP